MRFRRSALLPALALLTVVALVPSCGGKDATSPPPPPTGPTFNFTYSGAGGSNSFTFTEAGDWAYRCTFHSTLGMTGTIFVRESSTRTSATVTVAPGNALVFSPDTVTIKTGGTITWTSGAVTVAHTATRP